MAQLQNRMSVQMFYSYSHKDVEFQKDMEKSLSLIQREVQLQQWSDQQIVPGRNISPKIKAKMEQADIFVFLLSHDFLASKACMEEWEYAKKLSLCGKVSARIPVIVRECAWLDLLEEDDVKALPYDGQAISGCGDEDRAWKQVYEGIKAVVEEMRNDCTPKEEFINQIDKTEFLSRQHLKLQNLFEFLHLTCSDPDDSDENLRGLTITDQTGLLAINHALIHGQERSGKTALVRHLYLTLIEKAQPTLLLDLANVDGKLNESYFCKLFQMQFHGDYSRWVQKDNKTLLVDNLTAAGRSLDLIVLARKVFDRIIVVLSSDIFHSYFRDELRLADFRQMKIEPLTPRQQEKLIRKRLNQSNGEQSVPHGLVDRVESHVNSITISNHILPRYPFFVLSILQVYEAYMPTNMSVTSYGHCYHALIVANLMRSGISNSDDEVNACFNFAEHLAFKLFEHRKQQADKPFVLSDFLLKYKKQFLIKVSIINRLKSPIYGLIGEDGFFRSEYMYYYFLGKFLSRNQEGPPVIASMCEESYREANYLTLLFTIHHTSDNSIIDDILLRTMCSLDSVNPAHLKQDETKKFQSLIEALPENILSEESVEAERGKAREGKGNFDSEDPDPADSLDSTGEVNPVNGMFRILRNNKIMGQVLRSKHGNLEKSKIVEIVEIISDSGLRLVNLILKDEDEITALAHYLHGRHPEWDLSKIKNVLMYFSFLWTMEHVEAIVKEINIPEIREPVNAIVNRRSTPAYDLIGYFSQLDSAESLTKNERDRLASLMKRHKDSFIQRVLSIRTQQYMNTHRSSANIEQSVCSQLRIRYNFKRLRGL